MAEIDYRPFRNSDPPALAQLWSEQPPQRGLAQPMSVELLESFVFSKPYFDPAGLIVAVERERIVGFVHAGFGAAPDFCRLQRESGAICMLMVASSHLDTEVAQELLTRGETFLIEHGAQTIFGGASPPVDPFYRGLYGGADLPGILASDTQRLRLFQQAAYQEHERYFVFHRQLDDFRAPMDRVQLFVRRQFDVNATADADPQNWWEACDTAVCEHAQFHLFKRGESVSCGQIDVWDMEPLADSWQTTARGLVRLEIAQPRRRQGLATFLISEVLKQLQRDGVQLVEAQAPQSNSAGTALYRKLGFVEVDQGIVFRKEK